MLALSETGTLLSVDRASARPASTHAKFKTVLSRLGWCSCAHGIQNLWKQHTALGLATAADHPAQFGINLP